MLKKLNISDNNAKRSESDGESSSILSYVKIKSFNPNFNSNWTKIFYIKIINNIAVKCSNFFINNSVQFDINNSVKTKEANKFKKDHGL